MQKLTEPQKLWIAALRSGKYEQAQDKLQDGDGFCCLGVCAKVYEDTEFGFVGREGNEIAGDTLSGQPGVRDWSGLHHAVADGFNHPDGLSLVEMNDRGQTFHEIADELEARPELYFVTPGESD
jgi:hypothetical protein